MLLRDYLYLDLQRLEDYLASFYPGQVTEIRKIQEERKARSVEFNKPSSSGGSSHEEITLSVSAKNSFNQLYETLSDSIINIDEKPGEISGKALVEVTRDFKLWLVPKRIDSFLKFLKGMQSSPEWNDEADDVLTFLSDLLREDSSKRDALMIANSDTLSYSVVFLADRQYMLRKPDQLTGEMTLVGRARRVVPEGQEFDLLTFSNMISNNMNANESTRDALIEIFEDWPDELSPEPDPDALAMKGPAIIVDPLAIFT